MPLDDGAGHSDDTELKQRDFGYVLGVMLRIAKSCMQKEYAYKEFLYFDLNAGPGAPGGHEGSPLIFARTAIELGLPFHALLFEAKQENATRLVHELTRLWSTPKPGWSVDARTQKFTVVIGDHNESVAWALDQYLSQAPRKWVYGLGYGDGNGKTDAPFGPMALLAERFPQVDLLLNVNATVYKRLRGGNPGAGFLLDDLRGIQKKRRLIRRPIGIHQWTMVFQTNWDGAPEFSQIEFHRIESPEGRQIASTVNFRKPERGETEQVQRPLELCLPTGPTPSISSTRASSPSEPSRLSDAVVSASGVGRLAPPSLIT